MNAQRYRSDFIITYARLILILLLFLSVPVKAQKYNYFGIKFGYSPSVFGWSDHPFDFSYYYNHLKDPPKIDNFFFGFNYELSRNKNYSTLFEVNYKIRNYKFDEDKFNQFGQFTGTTSSSGEITYLSFAVSGKLRHDAGNFSFYGYAGLRSDIFIIKNGYISLLKQNADLNSFMFGLNSGAGIAYGRKHRFSLEFYFLPDLTKHFSSSTGSIRYGDYGFALGYGVVLSSK